MKSLNETYIPKTVIKKNDFKSTNPLLQRNTFDKTHGNIYVQLDPPEIKFNGYELNKTCTGSFKIINKAPIPQRFNILPPSQSQFSIQVNKKGSIPTGMYETVQVFFKADEYKYMYDVIRINTETQNFVVPVYAYPSIVGIERVFPKMIDFGNVELRQTESNLYPIRNTTPIEYAFEFAYVKECPQIIITPLKGTIPSDGELMVEIAFIPSKKMTYTAEVWFKIQQFDFEPRMISIIGTGKESAFNNKVRMGSKSKMGMSGQQSIGGGRRLKSSKLAPLGGGRGQNEDGNGGEKERMNQTENAFNSHGQNINNDRKGVQKQQQQQQQQQGLKMGSTTVGANMNVRNNIRRNSSKLINYPKLLVNKTSVVSHGTKGPIAENQKSLLQQSVAADNQTSVIDAKNADIKQFLSRYTKVQELDKVKEIKFSQFIGDRAMTEQQINDEKEIVSEMQKFRDGLFQTKNQTRYGSEKQHQGAEVEFLKVKKRAQSGGLRLTWDDNRNDELYERRAILGKFVKAASKVIEVRRMKQRLEKIRVFLADCTTREEVANKVEVDYVKSLEAQSQGGWKGQIDLTFDTRSLEPSFFELQYVEAENKSNTRLFETEGKTEFDDLQNLTLIQPHETERLNYGNVVFPADFVHPSKLVPENRISGEEQFSVKTSSLPQVDAQNLPQVTSKPLNVPNHYFIYQQNPTVRMKAYNFIDEKDPLYLLAANENQTLEDEFQGWSHGEFEVLKHKLMKNVGVEYQGVSGFNYSSQNRNDLGFVGSLTQNLPDFIDRPKIDDQLEEDDSDEERYEEEQLMKAEELVNKLQSGAPQVKERREKDVIVNEDGALKERVERNLEKDKRDKCSLYVGKTKEINKYIQDPRNYLLM